MKLLLSCLQSPLRHPIPAYGFWRDYFVGGLGEAGHELLEVPGADWAGGLCLSEQRALASWKDQIWSATVKTVKAARERQGLDLCLFYLYPQQVESAAIKEIHALGIPCVNFFCDNVREFRQVPEAYRCFALNWVPEHKALALYKKAGMPHLCTPMPCWIPPHLRTPVSEEQAVVRFIGSADHTRRELLAELLPLGLPLELSGPGWKNGDTAPSPSASLGARLRHWQQLLERQGFAAVLRRVSNRFSRPQASVDFAPWVGETFFGDPYIRHLSSSAVSLGINRYPSLMHPLSKPDTYSRLRDIEAPMAGACYLTEWTEGLDQLYELGTEIEVYRDTEELCAKAKELLANPARRLSLRQRGFQRAHSDHTIGASLNRIRLHLGLQACPS